jgi:hypothetical protein
MPSKWCGQASGGHASSQSDQDNAERHWKGVVVVDSSREEAVTQLARAMAILIHPGEIDAQRFERLVRETLIAQQAMQAATAQAAGAANCHITDIHASCKSAQATLAPSAPSASPVTSAVQAGPVAARPGPIRVGAAQQLPLATAPSPSSTNAANSWVHARVAGQRRHTAPWRPHRAGVRRRPNPKLRLLRCMNPLHNRGFMVWGGWLVSTPG